MNEDIKKLKEIIENSKKIVFFGGAGVSTESNIPDFRSEEGLYNAQKQYGMSPEYMLSHSYFIDNPEGFYDYYKHNLVYEDAKPNKAHYALAKLEQEGKLIAVVTQNVDGLHQKLRMLTDFIRRREVKQYTSFTALQRETTAWIAGKPLIWITLWTLQIATDMYLNATNAEAL